MIAAARAGRLIRSVGIGRGFHLAAGRRRRAHAAMAKPTTSRPSHANTPGHAFPKGRLRELSVREALIVTCGYARNNITEEIWAEIFDVDQSTISRCITFLTPLIDHATAGFRPAPEEAAEATRGAIALVDGTLWPCWSWAMRRELQRIAIENDAQICGQCAGPGRGRLASGRQLPARLLPGTAPVRQGGLMVYEVVRSRLEYDGALVKVRVDTVVQPDGSRAEREVVEHVGSVAIVAVDDRQRVLLIRQYRHPAGQYLWELPAGLCDKPGESPLGAAQRELAEEAQLRAAVWRTLADLRPSPGISTEVCRVYQAEHLDDEEQAGGRPDEESELRSRWVPLPQAVSEVLTGRITNGLAVAGLLAAAAGIDVDRTRPADVPWPGSAQ
jgi:8-oxo-dGTP pyrophosphatase MutT (NUDIX family)